MAEFIEVDLKWFPILKTLKNPNTFKTILEGEYNKAAKRCGMKLAALMRKKIRSGKFKANKPMTIEMKGSSKPLVDEGRLFKSVTFLASGSVKGPIVTVGVMRSSEAANVARIVSEGATIVVTPKMSRMFKALHAASTGRPTTLKSERANELLAKSKGTIPALKVGTSMIIPPRPFAFDTLKDPMLKTIVEFEFNKALEEAFKKMAK